MAEHINREAVMKIAKDGNHSDFGRSMADLTSLREVLEDTPTADVVEVRHGKWLNNYKSGTLVNEGFISSCCDMWNERKSSFCPNCGAKMDGGDNE